MNRAVRRALARLTRAGAHRPDEATQRLEAELRDVREQLAALEAKHDQVPGVTETRRDWFVLVGGQRVDLKAIPANEWLKSLEELPAFLFTFALERTGNPGKAPDASTLEQVTSLAKRWIAACAIDPGPVDLDRLTLPEAEHAVAHIAELNGVTAHLRAWFRKRLEGMAPAAPDRQIVRGEAERPPGDLPN